MDNKTQETGYRNIRSTGRDVLIRPAAPPRLLPGSGGMYSGDSGDEFNRTNPLPEASEALVTRGRPGAYESHYWPSVAEEHRKFTFHDPTGASPQLSVARQQLCARGRNFPSITEHYDNVERQRLAAAGSMPPPAPSPFAQPLASPAIASSEGQPPAKRQKTMADNMSNEVRFIGSDITRFLWDD